jgi:hypothetical protein
MVGTISTMTINMVATANCVESQSAERNPGASAIWVSGCSEKWPFLSAIEN